VSDIRETQDTPRDRIGELHEASDVGVA
jgi:hypothetical protein